MSDFIEVPIAMSVLSSDPRVDFSEILDEDIIFEWFGEDGKPENRHLVPEKAYLSVEHVSCVSPTSVSGCCMVDIYEKAMMVFLSQEDLIKKINEAVR